MEKTKAWSNLLGYMCLFPHSVQLFPFSLKSSILESLKRMNQLLGVAPTNPFSFMSWTFVHTNSCLHGSLFGHLFKMLNKPRHNHKLSSHRKKMWLLNKWYFHSTLRALSEPRINVLPGEWNQQHMEKWWPFWFSNKHSSERPSMPSGISWWYIQMPPSWTNINI